MELRFCLFMSLLAFCCGQFNPLCNDEAVSIGDCMVEEGLPRTNPPSYIMYSLYFLPICEISNMTRLINCHHKVINECPYYRDNGPALMDKPTFLAFVVGTCINKQVLEKGVSCIGRRDYLIHQYNNKFCLTNKQAYMDLWDAYIMLGDWTWEKYCSTVIEGIECSLRNARKFGCTDEFWEALRLSTYLRLPVECRSLNTKDYSWLDMYSEIPEVLEFIVPQESSLSKAPRSFSCYTVLIAIMYVLSVVGAP